MTSVNAMNAYNKGKREGNLQGWEKGYDTGFKAGQKERDAFHSRERRTLRRLRIILYIILTLFIGIAWTNSLQAQVTADTSVTVVIPVQVTAEVSCNPTNCPEIGTQEPVVIQNTTQEGGLLQRIWSAILKALT